MPACLDGAYDVVVVGSGFGGASVACRLAQAGRSVAVLERGRRWEAAEFPRAIAEVGDAFWSDGRGQGFLEYLAFRKVDVVQGAGVGGGSLHYFNVNVRAPAAVLERSGWPAAVTRTVLEPYYDIAHDMLESAPFVAPAGRDKLPARTEVFLAAARQAALPVESVPVAVYTGEDRRHRIDLKPQNACTYCGNCLFGCDIGAKNTLDRNYLAVAERHGAVVAPLHAVHAVAEQPGGGYEVHYRRLEEGDPGSAGTPGAVRAASVVLAAGALGSTHLLLRSRDVERSLPRLGPTVGRRFSLNGEFLFAAARETVDRVDPGRGPPITAMVVAERNGHVVTVEDLGLPDTLLWFLEGALPPRTRLASLLSLASVYARRTFGIGARTSRLKLEMDALVAGGRTPHMLPYLGMGTDSADGVLSLRDGELDIEWSPRRNRKLYRDIEQLMSEVSGGAGGRFQTSFLWRWPMRKVLTAHPLGGCAMGDDPRTSVVDHRGEVWGHPGLYVIDGSIMPGALAVNPSLTITALGERAAFWMIHDREMTATDRAIPANA